MSDWGVTRSAATGEQAVTRAAAAVSVLVEGASARLPEWLSPRVDAAQAEHWKRLLCEAPREARARALASILASLAMDLDDWGLG